MDSAPADTPDPEDPLPDDEAQDSPEKSQAPAEESSLPPDDVAAIDELGKVYQGLREELAKVIIGQEDVVEQLAICLFSRGHALLMGVPGLAKTLLVSSVGECILSCLVHQLANKRVSRQRLHVQLLHNSRTPNTT